MIADLHNHTPLCNHAEGTMSEYIEKAIEAGTHYFGFSDHAPMDYDPQYRMQFTDMKKYETDVKNVKKKYQDKIEILLGYEVDWLPNHMDKRVLNADVDYLIGSVHFLEGWGFDNPEFIGGWESQDIDETWQKYFDTIQEMAESKLFDIVGHLDLIKVFKYMPKGDINEMAKSALVAIKNAGMALEINGAGFRKPIKEAYPSKSLLKQAFDLDIPITFSSDAHKPEQVSMFANQSLKLAQEVGYTECVVFKKRQKRFINFEY
jgi:histidinol-phosphatase (PHP family)